MKDASPLDPAGGDCRRLLAAPALAGTGERARPRATVILTGRPAAGPPGAPSEVLVRPEGRYELVEARSILPRCGREGGFDAGSGAAVNLAAADAESEILVLAADGIDPSVDRIEAAADALDATGADAVVGRALPEDSGALSAASWALAGAFNAGLGGGIGAGAEVLAIRKATFAATGGFSETLSPQADALADFIEVLAASSRDVRFLREIPAGPARPTGVWAILKRQFRCGVTAYYGRRPDRTGRRLAAALAAPWRGAGRARTAPQRPAAFLLTLLGLASRFAGVLTAWLRGGKLAAAPRSPLLAEPSAKVVAPAGDSSQEAHDRDGQQGEPRVVASVVVPVKASHDCIRLCLASLLRQDMAEPYEVIVVVPRGRLAEELAASFPQAQLCFCPEGCGPGGSRNRGIQAARGRFIAFTDADCLPEADWLRRIVAACRLNEGRPVRGWTQPGHCYGYVCRACDLAEKGMLRPNGPRAVPGLTGANMCVSAELLKAGREAFAEGIYGAEELALLDHLPAGSGRVVLDPRAQVREMRRDRLVNSLVRMYRLGRGSGRMRRRMDVRGAVFARHLWLVPLLGPARFALSAWRSATCGWRGAGEFLRLSPLVLLQLACYSVGFAAGAVDRPAPNRAVCGQQGQGR